MTMKTYEIILLAYSALIFFAYLFIVYKRFGILPSISSSYYKLKHKAVFTFFIWSIAIPMIIIGSSPLMFWAGAFMAFVGASPAFKHELEGKVHIVGAVGGIVLGFLSMWIEVHLYYLPIIMAVSTLYMTLKPIKNHTWWIEVLAYLLIIVGLVIR
jgi:hypothetical protein